jgi:FixJ family two-component response regulator
MSEREILLVDSDSKARKQLADSFREAGYQVETTDSTAHVLCTVLEQQQPVVLLGSGSDKKIALSDLVPLLKKCNRGVTIILVSDEEPLPGVRSIRQEGIFYHALKPEGREDTAEILSAVECAFKQAGSNDGKQPPSPAESYAVAPVFETPSAAVGITKLVPDEVPASVTSDTIILDNTVVTSDTTVASRHREKKMRDKAAAIIAMLTAAVAGFVYCVFAATKGMKESGDPVMWGFLGFFALIVVGQLLPALFSVRAAKKVVEQQLQEVNGEKHYAYAALDKNK